MCPLDDDEKLWGHFLVIRTSDFRGREGSGSRVSAPESESSGAEASALEAAPSEEFMRESRLGARRGRGGEQSSQSSSRP